MKKLRWGILGTAKIAREWVIPAIHQSPYAEVVAVASRDGEKAAQYAAANKIPQSFDSYEALLEDPAIDAVYNPMPNHAHVPWSIKAIAAGKHVLCEKPLGLNAADIQPLLAAAAKAPKLVVMEAFMYRFHPPWSKVKELIAGGDLGTIQAVNANFSYNNQDPQNVRNQADIGGGGLMDIGCYCISVARLVFGREPQRALGNLDLDPRFGVDRHASALLDFGPGMATFFCSTQSDRTQGVRIFGDKANLIMDRPYYKKGDEPTRIILEKDDEQQVITIGSYNHFVLEIDAFSQAALNGQPAPTPLADALGNMRVIDAVAASAKENCWVNV